MNNTRDNQFLPLPSDEVLSIAWPTPNRFLFDAPEKFFARTRVNPDYGKPGFTRDCGKRFHRGCDIASVHFVDTCEKTKVMFTDCATGKDFESEEPVYAPYDTIFCVLGGRVAELVEDETTSDFGKHIVLEHAWPRSGEKFFTLYAHLSGIKKLDEIVRGYAIGKMGQTARSADARNWMAIAPHLHFEVWDAEKRAYDPVEFLKRFLQPSL